MQKQPDDESSSSDDSSSDASKDVTAAAAAPGGGKTLHPTLSQGKQLKMAASSSSNSSSKSSKQSSGSKQDEPGKRKASDGNVASNAASNNAGNVASNVANNVARSRSKSDSDEDEMDDDVGLAGAGNVDSDDDDGLGHDAGIDEGDENESASNEVKVVEKVSDDEDEAERPKSSARPKRQRHLIYENLNEEEIAKLAQTNVQAGDDEEDDDEEQSRDSSEESSRDLNARVAAQRQKENDEVMSGSTSTAASKAASEMASKVASGRSGKMAGGAGGGDSSGSSDEDDDGSELNGPGGEELESDSESEKKPAGRKVDVKVEGTKALSRKRKKAPGLVKGGMNDPNRDKFADPRFVTFSDEAGQHVSSAAMWVKKYSTAARNLKHVEDIFDWMNPFDPEREKKPKTLALKGIIKVSMCAIGMMRDSYVNVKNAENQLYRWNLDGLPDFNTKADFIASLDEKNDEYSHNAKRSLEKRGSYCPIPKGVRYSMELIAATEAETKWLYLSESNYAPGHLGVFSPRRIIAGTPLGYYAGEEVHAWSTVGGKVPHFSTVPEEFRNDDHPERYQIVRAAKNGCFRLLRTKFMLTSLVRSGPGKFEQTTPVEGDSLMGMHYLKAAYPFWLKTMTPRNPNAVMLEDGLVVSTERINKNQEIIIAYDEEMGSFLLRLQENKRDQNWRALNIEPDTVPIRYCLPKELKEKGNAPMAVLSSDDESRAGSKAAQSRKRKAATLDGASKRSKKAKNK